MHAQRLSSAPKRRSDCAGVPQRHRIRNGTAIRSDPAIAVAFMHAQRLSSVQNRHTIRGSVPNRRSIRGSVLKRRANRDVYLGKSHNRQPQPSISQF